MAGGLTTLFLRGDVMPGRGVDQILPYPGDPELREEYLDDARTYVRLAERANGPIPHPVSFSWPWGDALEVLAAMAPDVRVINLETSVTRSADFAPGKAEHYRMSPQNLPCLTAIRPDACALANNHVLDFGRTGLAGTLGALAGAGLPAAGAGPDAARARQPAIVPVPGGGRAVIFSCGAVSSGIPAGWAADATRPGVDLLPDLSGAAADALRLRQLRRRLRRHQRLPEGVPGRPAPAVLRLGTAGHGGTGRPAHGAHASQEDAAAPGPARRQHVARDHSRADQPSFRGTDHPRARRRARPVPLTLSPSPRYRHWRRHYQRPESRAREAALGRPEPRRRRAALPVVPVPSAGTPPPGSGTPIPAAATPRSGCCV